MTAPQYVGVDIGGTSIRAARFVGQNPVPSRKTKPPTQAAKGAGVILRRLETAIRAAAGGGLEHIAGIGIAAPGRLDPNTGVEPSASNLTALGEWKLGAGQGAPGHPGADPGRCPAGRHARGLLAFRPDCAGLTG